MCDYGIDISWSYTLLFGKVQYCPASQEWQWRHVLITELLGI